MIAFESSAKRSRSADRNTEHVADDRCRDRKRELAHDLEFAAPLRGRLRERAIEYLVHQRLDLGAHRLDPRRAECLGQQRADARVVRRIDVEDRDAVRLFLPLLDRQPVFGSGQRLLAETPVFQDRVDVFVPRRVPDAARILEQPLRARHWIARVRVLEMSPHHRGLVVHRFAPVAACRTRIADAQRERQRSAAFSSRRHP